jgi:PAS domain-containing protein
MESIESSNYRERSPLADALAWPSLLIADLDDASALAQAIVDTIRDPLLILDQGLRVVTANRAFHQTSG